MPAMRSVQTFLGLGMSLLLAACGGSAASGTSAKPGGSAPAAPVQLAAYQGSDRQALLEAGARKEGSLTWYTTLAGNGIDALVSGFKEKYPFLQVDVFRADEQQIATRATQEAQANKQTFDVVEVAPVTTAILKEAGITTPFFSPQLAKLPDEFKAGSANGLVDAAAVRIAYASFGYNTKLVPDSAVPKTQADLLNPGLTGKLALTGSTTGSNWVGNVLHTMGDEAGRKFLAQLAAQQKPAVHQVSGQALLDLIAKGEVAASPTIFLAHVQGAAAQGAPVKWVPLDSTSVANVGQDSFAAKAPHPNAGLLYMDYLLNEGQDVLRKASYFPAVDKVQFTPWVPDAGKAPSQAEKDLNSWTELFKTTFR
jgi:iron(III) transport system substrate-binding protein